MLQERMRTKAINHKSIGVVSLRCLLSFAAEFLHPRYLLITQENILKKNRISLLTMYFLILEIRANEVSMLLLGNLNS